MYMGAKDIARQELNVFRMELLGAAVVPVEPIAKREAAPDFRGSPCARAML